VCRAEALDFGGCNSRPGTGWLHPVNNAEARAERVLGLFANRLKCRSTLPVQNIRRGFERYLVTTSRLQ
jgi:hypothetical protein